MIGKEFDEDDISKLLTVFGTSPFLLFPFLENLVQLRRGSLIVDDLSVLARNVEWLRNQVRNIFAYKHIWVKMAMIDFLGQIWKERSVQKKTHGGRKSAYKHGRVKPQPRGTENERVH